MVKCYTKTGAAVKRLVENLTAVIDTSEAAE
jgi:hypothetical protein